MNTSIYGVGIGIFIIVLIIVVNNYVVNYTFSNGKKKTKKKNIGVKVNEWFKIRNTNVKITEVSIEKSLKYEGMKEVKATLEIENKGRRIFEFIPIDFFILTSEGLNRSDDNKPDVKTNIYDVKTLKKGAKLRENIVFVVNQKAKVKQIIYNDFSIKRIVRI